MESILCDIVRDANKVWGMEMKKESLQSLPASM